LGDYTEAAAVQHEIIAAAGKAGLHDAVQRMAENLRLYQRRQPNRTPWRPDEVAIILPAPSSADVSGSAAPR
jgi:hypothetical protein